jgi:hypothetical protein
MNSDTESKSTKKEQQNKRFKSIRLPFKEKKGSIINWELF